LGQRQSALASEVGFKPPNRIIWVMETWLAADKIVTKVNETSAAAAVASF
jgi:hypothetical protein